MSLDPRPASPGTTVPSRNQSPPILLSCHPEGWFHSLQVFNSYRKLSIPQSPKIFPLAHNAPGWTSENLQARRADGSAPFALTVSMNRPANLLLWAPIPESRRRRRGPDRWRYQRSRHQCSQIPCLAGPDLYKHKGGKGLFGGFRHNCIHVGEAQHDKAQKQKPSGLCSAQGPAHGSPGGRALLFPNQDREVCQSRQSRGFFCGGRFLAAPGRKGYAVSPFSALAPAITTPSAQTIPTRPATILNIRPGNSK